MVRNTCMKQLIEAYAFPTSKLRTPLYSGQLHGVCPNDVRIIEVPYIILIIMCAQLPQKHRKSHPGVTVKHAKRRATACSSTCEEATDISLVFRLIFQRKCRKMGIISLIQTLARPKIFEGEAATRVLFTFQKLPLGMKVINLHV